MDNRVVGKQKTSFFLSNYHMEEYIWLCGSLHTCYRIILIFNVLQEFNIIIGSGIAAPGHGRNVLDSLNAT